MKAHWKVLALAIVCVPTLAAAQGSMSHDMDDYSKQGAFKIGPTANWTIGVPHVDINGGYFFSPEKNGAAKVQTGFVNARMQAGLGTEYVQLAANALIVPKLGGSAQFTSVIQVVPTKMDQPVHISVGAGVVGGPLSGGARGAPWVEAVIALRTPIHVIAPFAQVGMPIRDGARAQVMIGLAHPLMPYKFHLLH